MIPIEYYFALAITIFGIGIYGIMTQTNIIKILMCLEIALNGVNVIFVASSAYLHNLGGQIFALFIIAIAAAEVAVGLAIIVALYYKFKTINLDNLKL